MHSPEDEIDKLNLDYLNVQIKATIAIAAHLAMPVADKNYFYLPFIEKIF